VNWFGAPFAACFAVAPQQIKSAPPSSKDVNFGPGEFAVKLVSVSSLSNTARSADIFTTSLKVRWFRVYGQPSQWSVRFVTFCVADFGELQVQVAVGCVRVQSNA
jgi:hypothetical protein